MFRAFRCRHRRAVCPAISLELRIQRVLALFVEFILQFQADVVSFDGADDFCDGVDPPIHLEFAEF